MSLDGVELPQRVADLAWAIGWKPVRVWLVLQRINRLSRGRLLSKTPEGKLWLVDLGELRRLGPVVARLRADLEVKSATLAANRRLRQQKVARAKNVTNWTRELGRQGVSRPWTSRAKGPRVRTFWPVLEEVLRNDPSSALGAKAVVTLLRARGLEVQATVSGIQRAMRLWRAKHGYPKGPRGPRP